MISGKVKPRGGGGGGVNTYFYEEKKRDGERERVWRTKGCNNNVA